MVERFHISLIDEYQNHNFLFLNVEEEEKKCHKCTQNMFRSLEAVCELMSIPDTCPEEEGCKDEARLDPSITLHSGEENEAKLLALILVCFPISTLTILLQ